MQLSKPVYTRFHFPSPPSGLDVSSFPLVYPYQISKPSTDKFRVLFLYDYIASNDLESGTFLGKGGNSHTVLCNLLQFASQRTPAKLRTSATLEWSALPIFWFRFFHLHDTARNGARSFAYSYWRKWLQVYASNFDLIVCFGTYAARNILPTYEPLHLGRVMQEEKLQTKRLVTLSYTELCAHITAPTSLGIGDISLLGGIGEDLRGVIAGGKNLYDLSSVQPKYRMLNTVEDLQKALAYCSKYPELALDVEAEGLHVHGNRILLLQLAVSSKFSFILPLYHYQSQLGDQKSINAVRRLLSRYFTSPKLRNQTLIGAYINFDLRLLRSNLGIDLIDRPIWDVRAASYVLDENRVLLTKYLEDKKPGSLEAIAAHYGSLYYSTSAFHKGDRVTIARMPLEDPLLAYSSMDVQLLCAIKECQLKEAELQPYGDGNYRKAFEKYVLYQTGCNIQDFSLMYQSGTKLDETYLRELMSPEAPLRKLVKETKQEVYALPSVQTANKALIKQSRYQMRGLFGAEKLQLFDLGTTAHKELLFFRVLDLEPISLTKTGKPSMGKDFLEAYMEEVPEVKLYERITKLEKLWGTFIKPFLRRLIENADVKKDHRIHPTFDFGPVTGRSASRDPSFQQLPVHSKEAPLVSRMFIAEEGRLYIEPDFSAHEVRVWGISAQDKNLLKLFLVGLDLRKQYRAHPSEKLAKRVKFEGDSHRLTGADFFDIPIQEVTDDIRRATKALVFGLIYGMMDRTLANNLDRPLREVQDLIEKFFGRYPAAQQLLEDLVACAETNLYAYSPIGRLRHLYGYLSGSRMASEALAKQAKNSPVQGFASDIAHATSWCVMRDMARLRRKFFPDDNILYPSLLTKMVHDSSTFETLYRYILVQLQVYQWWAMTGVRRYYKRHFNLTIDIPFEIDFKIGCSAGLLHEWDWSRPKLISVLNQSLEEQVAIYPDLDVGKAMGSIMAVRKNKELMGYLNAHYPWLDDSRG